MTTESDLNDVWAEKEVRESLFNVRAALENATNTLQESLQRVQVAKDDGSYDEIKPSLKSKFDIWLNHFETTMNTIDNSPNIQDILSWRPTQ